MTTLLTTAQAAAVLQISPATLRGWVAQGRIATVRLGLPTDGRSVHAPCAVAPRFVCQQHLGKPMNVRLRWATPDIDEQIMYIARVSNPEYQDSGKVGLLYYCMEHGHVSPFEMANVCMEINTTRDIGRQILRHYSFRFQEFSQRYADATLLNEHRVLRECRLQDEKNRQNSIEVTGDELQPLQRWWAEVQQNTNEAALENYRLALRAGVAKEQARVLLPEGLTPSRMYMNGTIRSWIFYLKQRLDPSTQKEHRLIAQGALAILRGVAPVTMDAFFPLEAVEAPDAS